VEFESEPEPEPEYNLDVCGSGLEFWLVSIEDDEWNFSAMTLLMREKEEEGKLEQEGRRGLLHFGRLFIFPIVEKQISNVTEEDLLSRTNQSIGSRGAAQQWGKISLYMYLRTPGGD
jgi:hypothetical protein